ncbi:MAG: single-stranded-DNA-specific exonuclease RecJ [Clostridiaceae bacterium]
MIKNIKTDTRNIQEELKISAITAKLLVNRGISSADEAKAFLYPEIRHMNDPKLMKDLEKGVGLIRKNIMENKKIMIVGDYDVDGVISTYMLYDALRKCGADVFYEIPHRINDGYGINKSIIDKAYEQGINAIITCDNGITALDSIKYAREKGMEFIVTDHHEVPPFEKGEMLADAVIDPNQKNCGYPFKKLCGAGVVFKFIQVLFEEMDLGVDYAARYMHLLAIATVCDVVELTGENRIIVKRGIDEIPSTDNEGLRQLIKITGLEGKKITTYSLGFVIGPCINASGRLDWARKGVELFLAKDKIAAEKLARELFVLNKERKDMTINGTAEVIGQIEGSKMTGDSVLVVYNGGIHESVAGIIAGRLKEKYCRPAIMITSSKHGAKGSGRSIEGYNMFEELLRCGDLLEKFGGHPMAAGLSIEESKIIELRERLNNNTTLLLEELVPKLSIDMQLPVERVSMKLASELECLEPFGMGNPKPVFAERDIKVHNARIIGANKNVIRLTIRTESGSNLSGVYFGDIEEFRKIISDKYGDDKAEKFDNEGIAGITLDMAFSVGINEYMGNRSVQLVVTNIR